MWGENTQINSDIILIYWCCKNVSNHIHPSFLN